MTLPGFTAEASSYRTRELYQASGSSDQKERGIYPAQFLATPFPKI